MRYSFHNLEKSGFYRGQYVGYGAGLVWRIKRIGRVWSAFPSAGAILSYTAPTLREISDWLAAI
jgi:hypothetical protein